MKMVYEKHTVSGVIETTTHKVAGIGAISLKFCTPSGLWFFCIQFFLGVVGDHLTPR